MLYATSQLKRWVFGDTIRMPAYPVAHSDKMVNQTLTTDCCKRLPLPHSKLPRCFFVGFTSRLEAALWRRGGA